MQACKSERRSLRLPILAIALMFFYGFWLSGVQLVIARIADSFALSAASIGLLVSAQHVSASLAPICIGAMADRFGKKPMLIAFALIFGIGCLFCALAPSLWLYILGSVVIGAGYSVCETLVSSVLSEYDPERGMQLINLSQSLLCIGAVLSPILLRSLSFVSWRGLFYFCAAAFLLLGMLLASAKFPAAQRASGKRAQSGSRSFFTSGLFICLFVSILMYVGMENGFGYFVDSLFTSRGQAEGLSAIALSGYWAGMALSRLICGTLRYRAGRMLRLCFVLSALLFVLLMISRAGWLSIALSVLIGASYGPIWTTLVGSAAAAFPERSATAIGLMSTGCALGGILYPSLLSAVAARFSFTYAFGALAITALIACALCIAVKE